jgi:hypothetical protein
MKISPGFYRAGQIRRWVELRPIYGAIGVLIAPTTPQRLFLPDAEREHQQAGVRLAARGHSLRQGPLLVGIEAVEAADVEDEVEPVADHVDGEGGGVSLDDFRAGMRLREPLARLRERPVDQVDPRRPPSALADCSRRVNPTTYAIL